MQKIALTFASLVFCAVAVTHFVRFYFGWDFVIGGAAISLQVSLIAGIAAAALAVWMFLASRRPGAS